MKSGGNNSQVPQQAFSQLMQQMVTSMAGQGLNAPPEERFRTQLETLASMGFVDRQANIQGMYIIFTKIFVKLQLELISRNFHKINLVCCNFTKKFSFG